MSQYNANNILEQRGKKENGNENMQLESRKRGRQGGEGIEGQEIERKEKKESQKGGEGGDGG